MSSGNPLRIGLGLVRVRLHPSHLPRIVIPLILSTLDPEVGSDPASTALSGAKPPLLLPVTILIPPPALLSRRVLPLPQRTSHPLRLAESNQVHIISVGIINHLFGKSVKTSSHLHSGNWCLIIPYN